MEYGFIFLLKLDQWNYGTGHLAEGYIVESEEP